MDVRYTKIGSDKFIDEVTISLVSAYQTSQVFDNIILDEYGSKVDENTKSGQKVSGLTKKTIPLRPVKSLTLFEKNNIVRPIYIC